MTTTEHTITYVDNVTREFPALIDEDGNIVLTGPEDILDCDESSIYCSTCGLIAADEYEDHGISDYWEVL